MTPEPDQLDQSPADAAWRAYVEQDSRLTPPAHLEQRILEQLERRPDGRAPAFLKVRGISAAGSSIYVGLGAAAAIALVALIWWRAPGPAETLPPLEARRMSALAPPPLVAPDRPRGREPAIRSRRAEASSDLYVQHVELPTVFMMFEAGPIQDSEPLQLVRLRIPRESLQALGLVLLEPDTGGVVDVDVLVGEDGLAREIRKVRLGREQR